MRHFIDNLILQSRYERTLTTFEEYCTGSAMLHQTLSNKSALLVAPSEDFRLPFFRRWEMEIDWVFSEEQQNKMMIKRFESLVYIRMQETNFKILSQ